MRVAVVVVCVLGVGLAGCLGSDPGPQAGARLDISDFEYEDRPCDDIVPVRFAVRNVGDATANSVVAYADGGYRGRTDRLGDLDPGVGVMVELLILFNDECGVDDSYQVEVGAIRVDGPGPERAYNITI